MCWWHSRRDATAILACHEAGRGAGSTMPVSVIGRRSIVSKTLAAARTMFSRINVSVISCAAGMGTFTSARIGRTLLYSAPIMATAHNAGATAARGPQPHQPLLRAPLGAILLRAAGPSVAEAPGRADDADGGRSGVSAR